MHLKSCCALLLLALVACQAAPSPKTVKKPNETESRELSEIEGAGAEKERSKKSTTLCVDFNSEQEQQGNQVQQSPSVLLQEPSKYFYSLLEPTQQTSQSRIMVVPTSQTVVQQPTPESHIIQLQEQPQQRQNILVQNSQQIPASYSTVQVLQPQSFPPSLPADSVSEASEVIIQPQEQNYWWQKIHCQIIKGQFLCNPTYASASLEPSASASIGSISDSYSRGPIADTASYRFHMGFNGKAHF